MVIFLDTYEKLVDEMASVGEHLDNDRWLRDADGLIINSPNVLWVIGGREKLKWERSNLDWSSGLEQHRLGALSQSDSIDFLRLAGITDSRLQEGIYELTSGTPIYLDICVEQYSAMLQNGEEPLLEKFGRDIYTLIERFARYMDDAKKDMVYALSVVEVWNDEIARIVGDSLSNFSLTTYEKIKGFSFINESDGWYSMDRTVQEVMYKACSDYIKTTIRQKAIRFFKQKLEDTSLSQDTKDNYFLWSVQLQFKDTVPVDIILFFKKEQQEYFYNLLQRGKFDLAERLLALNVNHIEKDSVAYAYMLCEMSSLRLKEGKLQEARDVALEGKDLYLDLVGQEDMVYLRILEQYASCLADLGENHQSLILREEIVKKRKELSGEDHPDTLAAMTNLANDYDVFNRYEESLTLKEDILSKSRELVGEDSIELLIPMANLANTKHHLGQYEEALKLNEEVVAKSKILLGQENLETATSMYNLSIDYAAVGKYEQAFDMAQEVLTIRKKILGEYHPDTLTAMYNLAKRCSELGQRDEALKLNEEVLEKRKEILGDHHPSTIDAMVALSNCYAAIGRDEEALSLIETALAENERQFGSSHRSTMTARYNLASRYSKLGLVEQALEMRKEVWSQAQSILGQDHPETLQAMAILSIEYYKGGCYEEAARLQEEVLSKNQEILGISHPDTLGCMYLLADTYYALGRDDEAAYLSDLAIELEE